MYLEEYPELFGAEIEQTERSGKFHLIADTNNAWGYKNMSVLHLLRHVYERSSYFDRDDYRAPENPDGNFTLPRNCVIRAFPCSHYTPAYFFDAKMPGKGRSTCLMGDRCPWSHSEVESICTLRLKRAIDQWDLHQPKVNCGLTSRT